MENFTNNPGLQHLAEKIFLNIMEVENLIICQNINKASREILENSNFWLKKWKIRGLSKKNHDDWKKAVQLTKNTVFETNIISYMKKVLRKRACIDIRCYINEECFQNTNNLTLGRAITLAHPNLTWYNSYETFEKITPSNAKYAKRILGIFQILAPMIQNPNRSRFGTTLIYEAVVDNNIELIEILAPLLEDPNEPNQDSLYSTPIGMAAKLRRVDIIKVLAPLSINPNALIRGTLNWTPIYWATVRGDTEVIKALIPWTENPNAPNPDGGTPHECAVRHGHTEIVELLRPFAPDDRAEAKSVESQFYRFIESKILIISGLWWFTGIWMVFGTSMK